MPGIDFDVVRREISMQQVLDAIGFSVTTRSGDQLRGPCPVYGSRSKGSRVFSVNLGEQRYYCHKCKVFTAWKRMTLTNTCRERPPWRSAFRGVPRSGTDVPEPA